MNEHKNRHRVLIKIIAMVVVCLFTFNTVSWAYPGGRPISSDTLQVQSIFKPIIEKAGWQNKRQIKMEFAFIMAMAMKVRDGEDVRSYNINAELDRWLGSDMLHMDRRFLDVLTHPVPAEREGVLEFTVGFLGRPDGERFRIATTCRSFSEIGDETKISVQPVEVNTDIRWPEEPVWGGATVQENLCTHASYIAEIIDIVSDLESPEAKVWTQDNITGQPVFLTLRNWLKHGALANFGTILNGLPGFPDGPGKDAIIEDLIKSFPEYKLKISEVSMLLRDTWENTRYIDNLTDVVWTKENPALHEIGPLYLFRELLRNNREEKIEVLKDAKVRIDKALKSMADKIGPEQPGKSKDDRLFQTDKHGKKMSIKPLNYIPKDDIKNILIFSDVVYKATKKIGESVIDLWALVTSAHEKYPDAVIYVATAFPGIFRADLFGGKVVPIPAREYDIEDLGYDEEEWKDFTIDKMVWTPDVASYMYRLEDSEKIRVEMSERRHRFLAEKKIDLIFDVGIMPMHFRGVHKKMEKAYPGAASPHVISIRSAIGATKAFSPEVWKDFQGPDYEDREGNVYGVAGIEELRESIMPGRVLKKGGIWETNMGVLRMLGLDVDSKNLASINLSVEESVGALMILKEWFYSMNEDAAPEDFDPTKKIIVVNVYAVTHWQDILTSNMWSDLIDYLVENIDNAYFIFTHGGEMDQDTYYVDDIVQKLRSHGSDILIPKVNIYPYINDILGISSGLVTLDTGLSHIGNGVYGVPTAVITTPNILHWLTPRANAYPVMANDLDVANARFALEGEMADLLSWEQRAALADKGGVKPYIESLRPYVEFINNTPERPAAVAAKAAAASAEERSKMDAKLLANSKEFIDAEFDLKVFLYDVINKIGIREHLEILGVSDMVPKIDFVDSVAQTGVNLPRFVTKLYTPESGNVHLLVDTSALERVVTKNGSETMQVTESVKKVEVLHEVVGHIFACYVFDEFRKAHERVDGDVEKELTPIIKAKEEILARLMTFLALYRLNKVHPRMVGQDLRAYLWDKGIDLSVPEFGVYINVILDSMLDEEDVTDIAGYRYNKIIRSNASIFNAISRDVREMYLPELKILFGLQDEEDSSRQALLANLFTGRFSWLKNLPVRILGLLTLATPAHELGHIRASLKAGGKFKGRGWSLLGGIFAGEVTVQRGPPEVYFAGYRMNILFGLAAGLLAIISTVFSYNTPAFILSFISMGNFIFAFAESVGGRHGRGDLIDEVRWRREQNVSEEELTQLRLEEDMVSNEGGWQYHIIGGYKHKFYRSLKYLLGKGLLARKKSDEIYSPVGDEGDAIKFAATATREAKRVVEELAESGRNRIRILDFGTGTGITSLAVVNHAKKYAAEQGLDLAVEVDAVDISKDACDNALFNFNALFPHLIEENDLLNVRKVEKGHEFRDLQGKYDLILFNAPDPIDGVSAYPAVVINVDELRTLLNKLSERLSPEGVFLLQNRGRVTSYLLPKGLAWDRTLYSDVVYLEARDTFTGTHLGKRSSAEEDHANATAVNFFNGKYSRLLNRPSRIWGLLTLATFAHEMGHVILSSFNRKSREIMKRAYREAAVESIAREIDKNNKGRTEYGRDEKLKNTIRSHDSFSQVLRAKMRGVFLRDIFYAGRTRGAHGAALGWGGMVGNIVGVACYVSAFFLFNGLLLSSELSLDAQLGILLAFFGLPALTNLFYIGTEIIVGPLTGGDLYRYVKEIRKKRSEDHMTRLAETGDQRHQIGQEMGRYGHAISGGKSTGRSGAEKREKIIVDFSEDRVLRNFYRSFMLRFYLRLWREAGTAALGRVLWTRVRGGRHELQLPGEVKGRLVRIVYDTVESMVEYDLGYVEGELKEKYKGRWVLIGDAAIAPGRGVCRHHGIIVTAVLERLIKGGYLHGTVFYRRAMNHGWAEYRDSGGAYHRLDVAMKLFEPNCRAEPLEEEEADMTMEHAFERTMFYDMSPARDVAWDKSMPVKEPEKMPIYMRWLDRIAAFIFGDRSSSMRMVRLKGQRTGPQHFSGNILVDAGIRTYLFKLEGDGVCLQTLDRGSAKTVLPETTFPIGREYYIGRTRTSDHVDGDNDALSRRHFSVMVALDGAGHPMFQVTDRASRNGTVVGWDATIEDGVRRDPPRQEPEYDEDNEGFWKDDDVGDWEGDSPDDGDAPRGGGTPARQGDGEVSVSQSDVLSSEDLARYARMPRTNADDLIEYIRKTGLTEQAGVIRKALSGEVLFLDKLEGFEKKMLLLEVPTSVIQKTERLLRRAGDGVYSASELMNMGKVSDAEDVLVGLARTLAEIHAAAFSGKERAEVESEPLWDSMLSYRKALEKDSFFIAVNGEGTAAGFCHIKLNGAETRWELKTLAASPEHQESGYGTLLMDRMFEMIVGSKEYKEGICRVRILSALEGKVYNFYDSYLEKRKDLPADAERSWRLESEKLISSYDVSIVQISDNELKGYGEVLKENDRYSQRLFRYTKAFFEKMDTIGQATPVDVVIDLSLIPAEDMQKNMEVWASLILVCRDMRNVNFVLEGEPVWAKGLELPEVLRAQINNAPRVEKAHQTLMSEIYRKAMFFGVKGDLDELVLGRVKTERTSVAPGEDLPIEIPIASKELLGWARDNGITIGVNQYPVTLEGAAMEDGMQAALRNFEGALAVGLAKASMVLAKRRDSLEKDKGDKELPDLQETLLKSMQGIYKLFREDVDLTISDLDDMIDNSPTVRMNLAISLYLPPIARMVVETLQDLHDGIQLLLQAA